jgi:hypothetical protein
MPSPGVRLGIDFGTSHTVAVLQWPDGRVRPLLFDGSPLLPSGVFHESGAGLLVGRDAQDSARRAPGNFEPNPKRRIDEGELLLGDRAFPVRDAVAAVLARVRAEATRTIGAPVGELTVTCPANWGATRRFVLTDAAQSAGLPEPRLVPEPVAAATYFASVLNHEVPSGSAVVVYDLGAGTFDASVVSRTEEGFTVLALDGRDNIGGLDLDEIALGMIGAAAPPELWQRLQAPSTVEDQRTARWVRDEARSAKERLSRAASVAVPIADTDVLLTREEFEMRARPLIAQTVRVTEGVIRYSKIPPDRIVGVFLVGGASRMPLVGTLLFRALGMAPIVIEQPELVVAEGSVLPDAAAAREPATPVTPVTPFVSIVSPVTTPTPTPTPAPPSPEPVRVVAAPPPPAPEQTPPAPPAPPVTPRPAPGPRTATKRRLGDLPPVTVLAGSGLALIGGALLLVSAIVTLVGALGYGRVDLTIQGVLSAFVALMVIAIGFRAGRGGAATYKIMLAVLFFGAVAALSTVDEKSLFAVPIAAATILFSLPSARDWIRARPL